MSKACPRLLVIPDTQDKPGVSQDHLTWAGNYILDKRPEIIVHLGDHWDMPSLSSYETSAQKVAEHRDVLADVKAGNEGLRKLWEPVRAWNRRQNHRRRYKPRRILLRGNHDGETNGGRIHRALQAEPWLRGFFEDHPLESPGWEVVPFLEPIVLHGVAFCHYFPRSANGQVMNGRRGAPSAKLQVQREARSSTAGHKQGFDYHVQPVGGRRLHGLIAGSYYAHDESYLTPQGQNHWRGLVLKHEVHDGEYELTQVSMRFLKGRYS